MFLHFSAKKVECAKHQWIHLVGDQPKSPHAFENFVVNARWRSTWVRVYNSLTLQSSYKPSMHFTMTCTTTHNIGPLGVLTVGTCSLRQSTNCLWKGEGVRKTLVLVRSKSFSFYSAPIARALPRYIVPFFKFFKTGKCFKTMLFPVSCVSQKPLAFEKHSLLLIQPKTHAKTLSERSEKCATVRVLTGTDSVARATYLQRAL